MLKGVKQKGDAPAKADADEESEGDQYLDARAERAEEAEDTRGGHRAEVTNLAAVAIGEATPQDRADHHAEENCSRGMPYMKRVRHAS